MSDGPPPDLAPHQVATLEKLLRAGFTLVRLEHVERYLGVEKDGFAALLEPASGKFTVFGQVGYRMGAGIGMLVERPTGKAFVWHGQFVKASDDLLGEYERFRAELRALLEVGDPEASCTTP